MASSQSETLINDLFMRYIQNPDDETQILADAAMELKVNELGQLKKRIEGKKAKGKGKAILTPGTSATGGQKEDPAARDLTAEMKLVDLFWDEIEKMDPITLLSDDVLDAFKYIGFDPNIVLREVLHRGKAAKRSIPEIKKDMVDMVAIAIIKGSITEKNLKKTSDVGKITYKALQDNYQLGTGGAKGKDSTYLTVARVAAAVPGMVVQILVQKPSLSKTFVGPFSSKSLPPYLRHQASAACIPESTSEKLKEYLLGLITAFTADQTKVLSKSKDTAEELFDIQQNFVQTTFGSAHPSEATRKKIFSNFSLSNDFEKLNAVALRIKKVKTDFVILTQLELDAELAK